VFSMSHTSRFDEDSMRSDSFFADQSKIVLHSIPEIDTKLSGFTLKVSMKGFGLKCFPPHPGYLLIFENLINPAMFDLA